MRPIKLKCYFHTDETTALKNVGVNYSLEDCQLKEVIFRSIDVLSPYSLDYPDHTEIFSGGTTFVCPLSVDEINLMISYSNLGDPKMTSRIK